MENIFDSHAHYDDERFNEDRAEVLSFVHGSGVKYICNVGCDMQTSYTSAKMAEQNDFIYAAVGIHPHSASEVEEKNIEELIALSNQSKVVAIGEIGLDYHYDFSPRNKQIEVFARQLELAKSLDMPVIIHSREATEDCMRLLREYKPKGVVHCYSGSAETAKEILALGMYIGYTGVVTFGNARRVLEAVAVTPLTD